MMRECCELVRKERDLGAVYIHTSRGSIGAGWPRGPVVLAPVGLDEPLIIDRTARG